MTINILIKEGKVLKQYPDKVQQQVGVVDKFGRFQALGLEGNVIPLHLSELKLIVEAIDTPTYRRRLKLQQDIYDLKLQYSRERSAEKKGKSPS